MSEIPHLRTLRLDLRPFTLSDAAEVQRLCGDPLIASTTLNIPHPYADGVAETWIATHQSAFERRELVVWAIADRRGLIGAIGLDLFPQDHRGQLGYWIGVPYWNQGFATEAVTSVIEYGFGILGLDRIHASYLTRNPASGRVMAKAGMRHEGTLRQHCFKDGRLEDIAVFGILRTDRSVD
jgi:[ribosomal protein S5]-alanine N-acetyltransferase